MNNAIPMQKAQSLCGLLQHEYEVVHRDLILCKVVLKRQVLLPQSQQTILRTILKEEGRHIGMASLPQRRNHLNFPCHLRLTLPVPVHLHG